MRNNTGVVVASLLLFICAVIGYKSATKKKYATIDLRALR